MMFMISLLLSCLFLLYRTCYSDTFVPSLIYRDVPDIQELRNHVTLNECSNHGDIVKFCQKLIKDEIKIGHPWPKQKRFLTKPKEYIIFQVQGYVQSLIKNNFVDMSGTSARLLFGDMGIGKSCSLTLAVMATYMTYENVIPIYIEYSGNARNFVTPSCCLSEALGLDCHLTIQECLDKLEKMNFYSILIVDEIDLVYSSTEDKTLRLDILQELGELGTQRSGRIFTIICGSSSVTPSLITKQAVLNDVTLRLFPLVADCSSLNESKFMALRLTSGNTKKEDYEIVQSALNISSTAMNILYFLAGSNLRNMLHIFEKIITLGQKYTSEKIFDIFNPSAAWDQLASDTTVDTDQVLICALNSALVRKNYNIIKKLYRAIQNRRPSAISDTQWMKALKPLKFGEVVTVLESIRPYYVTDNRPSPTLLTIILLIDRGYYSGEPNIDELFPTRPIDLLRHFPYYENELQKKSFFSKIKNYFGIPVNELSLELQGELRLPAAEYIMTWFS